MRPVILPTKYVAGKDTENGRERPITMWKWRPRIRGVQHDVEEGCARKSR